MRSMPRPWRHGMTSRRAVLAAGLSGYPLAARAQNAQPRASTTSGTKQRAVRFAGSDGASLRRHAAAAHQERAAEGAGHRAGGGQRPDRPRRQQSAGARPHRSVEADRRAPGAGRHRHPALRQARHRRLDPAAARPARRAGAVLLLGTISSTDRRGRAGRAVEARRDQALRHGAARPQRGRVAGVGRRAHDRQEPAVRAGAGRDTGPSVERHPAGPDRARRPHPRGRFQRTIAAIQDTGHVPPACRANSQRAVSALCRSVPAAAAGLRSGSRRFLRSTCLAWSCRAAPTAKWCRWRTCSR